MFSALKPLISKELSNWWRAGNWEVGFQPGHLLYFYFTLNTEGNKTCKALSCHLPHAKSDGLYVSAQSAHWESTVKKNHTQSYDSCHQAYEFGELPDEFAKHRVQPWRTLQNQPLSDAVWAAVISLQTVHLVSHYRTWNPLISLPWLCFIGIYVW